MFIIKFMYFSTNSKFKFLHIRIHYNINQSLRIHKTDVDVWIEVEDHGQGISRKEIGEIFDKFYRGGGAHAVPGAGLGLYLVRTIVRQHGGEVDVVSTQGEGTSFRIRLPLLA